MYIKKLTKCQTNNFYRVNSKSIFATTFLIFLKKKKKQKSSNYAHKEIEFIYLEYFPFNSVPR